MEALIKCVSAKQQSDIKAWEVDEIKPCIHSINLTQSPANTVEGKALAHCQDCDLNSNLWLCLTCGNLGCGRAQYGGTGGNGHGVNHYESTGHPVSLKMGSISPEGTADVFCYLDGTEITDPKLSEHLANFGINVQAQTKTEKTLAELQLEQNMAFDFSMSTEDGKQFSNVFGPGLTGMTNLGNSCYLASVISFNLQIMQVLFSIPSFQSRYTQGCADHLNTCREVAATCFHCQMGKLASGLLNGHYSVPIIDDEGNTRGQVGISPSMFKDVIGNNHAGFSTMRQQDACEFFQHVLNVVEQKERVSKSDPSNDFRFIIDQRIQCDSCTRVSYKPYDFSSLMLQVPALPTGNVIDGKKVYQPIKLIDSLKLFFQTESRQFKCPFDNSITNATL